MIMASISESFGSSHSLYRVYIQSSVNNTIITLTNAKGDVLFWASGGSVGFKGSRKSSSYAAQAASERVGRKAKNAGISSVYVFLKGLGQGREASVRGLKSVGLHILKLVDITPIPHGGCRPPK